MITPDHLSNRAAPPLTPRQDEAVRLIESYQATAGEPPSYAWLARRLKITRYGAYDLVSRARRRACGPTMRRR